MKGLTEEKLTKMNRYLGQRAKAVFGLRDAANLYDFINALRYAYGLCWRYKLTKMTELIDDANANPDYIKKCIDAGILKPWNDTYWFDKAKAESLQKYILEHQN